MHQMLCNMYKVVMLAVTYTLKQHKECNTCRLLIALLLSTYPGKIVSAATF